MHDLDQFSEEPIDFTVEFQGKTLQFYLKPTTLAEFFESAKKGGSDPQAGMRRTFQKLLLDEDHEPVSKDWIDKLLSKPNLIPLGLKINAGINTALGLDELTAKKG
jgi:hypothetical protein